jgi:hypothetical protein
MKAAARLLLALAPILAAPAAARADGYISAGAGGGAGLSGELNTYFSSSDSMSGRLSLGDRIGPFAFEASMFGAGLVGDRDLVGMNREYDTLSLGVDLKYYFRIAGPLELYPKIGVNKTWLDAPDGFRPERDYQGVGWDLGGGAQLSFYTDVAMFGIWLDLTHQRTNLRDGTAAPLDGQLTMLTLGLTVGF